MPHAEVDSGQHRLPSAVRRRRESPAQRTFPQVTALSGRRGTSVSQAEYGVRFPSSAPSELDLRSVLALVDADEVRTVRQIADLEAVVAAIVEGSELTSTDDEHDPEGATIAYERAQASALLRQARSDLGALRAARRQLEEGRAVICADCGRDIDLERVAALPTATRCVACAA